jgi:hypothetical protein
LTASVLAQDSDELDALTRQLMALNEAGKYAEAVVVAEQAMALAEARFGPDQPQLARAQQPRLALSYVGPLRRGRAPLQARP